jgi:PKD repeat protein
MNKLFYNLTLILFSLIAFQSKASHFTGSDISYQCTSTPGVYKVSLKLYRDCSGIQICAGCNNSIPSGTTTGCSIGTTGTQILGASAACLGTSFGTFTLNAVVGNNGYDIIQTCSSLKTICTNCNTRTAGTYTRGMEVFVFEGNINLNGIPPSCCNVTIGYGDCCRNSALTTIQAGNFFTQATINRCQTPCNSAPTFTNDAVVLVCAGEDFVYNLGAIDPDGDSLSYAFGQSLASQGSQVTYIAPYSAAYPFQYFGAPNANATYPAGLRIDPKTGDIMFRPIGIFVGQLVIEVTQWKSISGVWTNVGMTRRDVQFQTRFCANNLPPLVQVNGIGLTINTSNFLIFAGQQFCLDIVATDQENLTSTPTILADTTDLTWNNPGLYSSVMSTATFTRNYILSQRGINGPKADSFKFCWTPPISAIRSTPYLFTFSGADRSCPLRSITTKGIAITVVKPKSINIDSTTKNTFCNNKITAININYTASNVNLVTGNTLTIQLSDSLGSFTNATTIGTKTTTDTIGFISVTFPSGLFTNSQYKIRINASSDTINLGTPYAVNFVAGFNAPIITANKDSICKGLVSTFKVTPNTAGLTYKWLKNNVIIANQTKDSLLVDSAYNYRSILSNTGCSDTSNIKYLTVHPLPKAGFTINNASQCLNSNNFIFTDTSKITTGSTSRLWTVNGIDTSTNITTNKSFENVGTYTIKLLAISNNGCNDSITKIVSVNPIPLAGFTINNTSQCINGNNFSFSDTSNITSGTLTRKWNFGTGVNDTSLLANANKSYSIANNYFIKLISTSNNGCKDSTTKTIIVYPKPLIGFTVNNTSQCINGNNFIFTDTSKIVSGSTSRLWTVNGIDTSTNITTNKSFNNAGTYSIKLLNISDYGCKDSITKTVSVNPIPKAGFTINNASQCVNGNNFSFNDTSNIASGTLTRKWNLGTGNNDTSLLASTNKSYSLANNYFIKLIVTSNYGCKDSISKSLVVHPKPAVNYIISNPTQCLKGNGFSFTDTSSITYGTIERKWNFGTGNLDTSNNANPFKNYTTPNTYTVKLVATSNNNCKDSISKSITVNPQPSAIITTIGNTDFCANKNVILKANQAASQTYSWLKNDSLIPQNNDSILLVSTGGTYQLVIKNIFNCIDTSTKTTVTVNPLPVANFTINNPEQCLSNNLFSFIDSSSIATGTLTRKWDFGSSDFDTSSLKLPTRVYANANTYKVKLISISNNNCLDSMTKTVIVNPQPKAGFTINNDSQCVNNNSFIFTDTTKNNSNVWNTGKGNYQTTNVATQTYTNVGNYTIIQVVKSDKNCLDTISKTITVLPKITIGNILGNMNPTSTINPYSYSVLNQANVTYNWTATNGTIQSGQGTNVVSVVWASKGLGSINAKITNANNCTDTANLAVNITTVGVNNFAINNFSQIHFKPNPFSTNLEINFTSATKEKTRLIITDAIGKEVFVQHFQTNIGDNNVITEDLSTLKPGFYMATLANNNGQSKAFKVIKN